MDAVRTFTAARTLATVGAVLVATMLAGCGEEESRVETVDRSERPAPDETQRQSLRDPRGDVLDKPADSARTVTREQLDLVRVTLARAGDTLTASFVTMVPPAPGMEQVVETYDRRQLVEGRIEVRHRHDGGVRAVARAPRGTFKAVPVKIVGRETVVRAPLSVYTRERVFKWRAYTVSTRPTSEIRDRVPDGVSGIAFFP